MTRDQEIAWKAAIDDERAARGRAGEHRDAEHSRAWWDAVGRLFSLFVRLSNENPVRQSIEGDDFRFPPELALVMAQLSGALAAGVIPDLIRDVATVGAPSMGEQEAHDIALAVAYRRAAEPTGLEHEGVTIRIADRRAVATLVEWYGVERTTVQGWARRMEPKLPPGPLEADALIALVKASGARYRGAGRGADAVRRRGGC